MEDHKYAVGATVEVLWCGERKVATVDRLNKNGTYRVRIHRPSWGQAGVIVPVNEWQMLKVVEAS